MKKLPLLSAILVAILAGCTTTNLGDIGVEKAEPVCARQCTGQYSQCISGGSQIGLRTETLGACKEALRVCAQTCPNKQ